jgi:hypothetical protein
LPPVTSITDVLALTEEVQALEQRKKDLLAHGRGLISKQREAAAVLNLHLSEDDEEKEKR